MVVGLKFVDGKYAVEIYNEIYGVMRTESFDTLDEALAKLTEYVRDGMLE